MPLVIPCPLSNSTQTTSPHFLTTAVNSELAQVILSQRTKQSVVMNNTEAPCCCFQHGVSAAELKTTEMSGFFHFLILSFLCQHPAFWLLGIILKYCTGVTMHLQYEKTVKKIIPALLSRSLHRTGVPSKKLKFLTHDMLCTVSNYLTFT